MKTVVFFLSFVVVMVAVAFYFYQRKREGLDDNSGFFSSLFSSQTESGAKLPSYKVAESDFVDVNSYDYRALGIGGTQPYSNANTDTYDYKAITMGGIGSVGGPSNNTQGYKSLLGLN